MTTAVLQRLPEARTDAVVDLVRYAEEGRLRIPDFQRPLNWNARDVLQLFDSIYRGLPIGSLLVWKQRADAARVRLGPIEVVADEVLDGWWVVDGQQRLTSLAACLLRPLPLPETPNLEDPYVVYFDSVNQIFEAPPKSGRPPDTWVPLPVLSDATRLSEWVHEWRHGSNRELRLRVFDAGRRIREYKLPLYIVETDDQGILREVFFRVNKTGRALKWDEVHDALYGGHRGVPSTVRQLSDELASLGMGKLDGGTLTNCLLALRGLDVTRPLSEHRKREPDVLKGAVADAVPVMKQALAFLKNQAEIPHLRLLPRTMLLEVLTRFFAVHADPNSRTRTLLVRWLWRSMLGDQQIEERTLERRAITAITDDEEGSIQAMLALVPASGPHLIELPRAFDSRTADSRLAILALASLGPRSLDDERPLDVGAFVEEHGPKALGFISRHSENHGPENRLLQVGAASFRAQMLERAQATTRDDPVLLSHAISAETAGALANDLPRFYSLRRASIHQALMALAQRLASWGRDRDRPSLEYLLAKAGVHDG